MNRDPVEARLRSIFEFLGWVFRQPARIIPRWRLTAGGFTVEFEGDLKMAKITVSQSIPASLSFVDGHGNPATVDGVPTWKLSPENVVEALVSPDGLSVEFSPTGVIGSTQIEVTADADLGEGVRALTVLGTLEVVPDEAVAGVLNFGEPTNIG